MAMFKKLKSLFVEEIEEAQTTTQGKAQAPMPRTKSQSRAANSAPVTNAGAGSTELRQGQVTDKFMKILLGAMDKANLDGFDYLEFKNSLQSLKKMQQMDEATRFQSAFAMAQTMGATPQNLVQTAQHYIKILEQEEKKFEQALGGNTQSQIGTKQQRMQALAAELKQKEAQIKKLESEITAGQKEHQKLSSDIKKASSKIENTKSDFIATYEAIRGQIVRDTDRIKQYLK